MNDFSKFNKIRNRTNRKSDMITNAGEVDGSNGFRFFHILWLYPDVMNLHGGRGDVMGLLHICNMLELPVQIRRWDSMREDIPWDWPHLIYMNAGELKCVPEITESLERQREGLNSYLERKGWFIATGSSGGVLADEIHKTDGSIINGLGLLGMTWRQRNAVYGDDIWFKTGGDDGREYEVIGNQIQVADVELAEGQQPLGEIIYGRGNCGKGDEGARTDNIIFTSCLGPFTTKNPEYIASLLVSAADQAGLRHPGTITPDMIEVENKSAEYIKKFMKDKIKNH